MYNVLICDDQPDIVNALKIYLAPEGYRLFEAATGTEALRIVKNQRHKPTFDQIHHHPHAIVTMEAFTGNN